MLKNRLYILTVIFLFANDLWAQESYSIGFLYSSPVGDYQSTDLENGSFAEPGWGVTIENKSALRNWPDNLYLGFHFSYQRNKLDQDEVSRQFTEAIGNPAYAVDVIDGNYNPFTFMIGPFYDIFLTDKIFLGLKSGIGIMFTNIDPMVINITDNSGNEVFSEVLRTEGVPAFTYLLGLSLNLKLSEYAGIGIFADYGGAKEQVEATFDNLPDFTSEYKLSYINTGLHLMFYLD